jgi:F-type H+-transporting ATPase subunit delta
MAEKKVSLRYARALLNTASDTDMIDAVYDDFIKIAQTFESSRELQRLTSNPIITVWRKKRIYTEIFDELKIHELTMKFLILLLDKGRGVLIPSIIQQYYELYNALNNKVPVVFSTARELNEDLKNKLIIRFKEYTKMDIIPKFKVSSELKGGIQITINDWVYDASIKNQLESLYKSLTE